MPMRAIPKPKTPRSKEYIEFVRRRDCCVTGKTEGVEAHHVVEPGHGKVGAKTSDFRTVPLIAELHREYHEIGRIEFEQKYNIDLEAEIIRLLAEFHRLPKRVKRKMDTEPRSKLVITRCLCGRSHDLKSGSKKIIEVHGRVATIRCPFKNSTFDVKI
jgi:hypothetical protein